MTVHTASSSTSTSHTTRDKIMSGLLDGAMITITIHQGRNLIGKDRNALGCRTTSDPYVIAVLKEGKQEEKHHNKRHHHHHHKDDVSRQQHAHPAAAAVAVLERQLGKTQVIPQTLAPVWNESLSVTMSPTETMQWLKHRKDALLHLYLYDHDQYTEHDFMGVVLVPLFTSTTKILKQQKQKQNKHGEHHNDDKSNEVNENMNHNHHNNHPATSSSYAQWYPVEKGKPDDDPSLYCPNAQGEIQVTVSIQLL